jgi:hypothetical protein
MARLKKSINVLLPVFWLVTFSYASFESNACARSSERTVATCPIGDASPGSGDLCCYSHDQLRHLVRRYLLERGQEKQLAARLLAGDHPLSPPGSITAIPLTGGAFLLQQRWQFLWRTADSPRAPTFLA